MWNRLSGMRFLLFALLLGATACSTAATILPPAPVDDPVTTTEAPQATPVGDGSVRVVEVELTEFAFAAESFTFTPGETVEFVVTNAGVVEHEFRLSNQDRVEEHLAGGHDDHDDTSMEDMENAEADHDDDGDDHDAEAKDAVLVLDGGESGTIMFTFPDNDHDYTAAVCLIPGHYEAGMATDLSYEG